MSAAKQVWRTLLTRQPYVDALATVASIVFQSVLSGAAGLAVNLVFTLGFIFGGRPPAKQSHAQFLAATMGYVSFFFAVIMTIGYCTPLAKYHWIYRPETPRSSFFWFARLVRVSLPHYVVSLAAVVAISFASASLDAKWKPYHLHYCASGFAFNYYSAVADVFSRRLFQTETVEGKALGRANSAPIWRRICKAYVKNFGHVVFAYITGAYVQLSSSLQLASEQNLLLFSFVSMAFRVALMKILLTLLRRIHKLHVRLLYLLTAVPTVMINTQVRVALLRVQGNVSTGSVVVLALVEPLMRIYKVWRVRHTIQRKTSAAVPQQSWTIVPAKQVQDQKFVAARPSEPTNSIGVPPRRVATLRSKKRLSSFKVLHVITPAQLLVQFTAAEIHADMSSEYIAIACSLSIYYCLHDHPQFAWDLHELSNAATSSRVQLVFFQLVIELAVDFGCTAWEIANGIPLRTSRKINAFMLGLFIGCAVTNTCVCCVIYLRQTDGLR